MKHRLFIVGLALGVLLSCGFLFAGGQDEAPATEGGFYAFTMTMGPWDLSQGRIPVEQQYESPYFQYVGSQAGAAPLTTSWEWDGGKGYLQGLRLMLASGDIPDALAPVDIGLTVELIEQGVAVPLDDYLEQYGQHILDLFPEAVWDVVRSNAPDGKIYYVPGYNALDFLRMGFIRKDWLDRVGMDVPQTRDELVAVYKAFKAQDANGNGDPNDEIPVSGREGLRWCDDLFVMHGVAMYEGYPQMRWDERSKTMVNDQVSNEMREALSFIRGLVAEGLMDPVMPVQPNSDWSAKINDNRIGHYFHLARSLDRKSAFINEHPDAEWAYLQPPKVPGLPRQDNYMASFKEPMLMITRNAEQPEKIIQWLDWCMDKDGGATYHYLGIPEKDWTLKDGEIVILNEDVPWNKYTHINMTRYIEDVIRKTPLGEEKVAAIDQAKDHTQYTFANLGMPVSVYDGYEDFMPNNATLYKEYASRIVLGELPISAWDDYVALWKKRGGDVITQRATEWYKKTYNYNK